MKRETAVVTCKRFICTRKLESFEYVKYLLSTAEQSVNSVKINYSTCIEIMIKVFLKL